MNTLQGIAVQYHNHADRIIRRHTNKDGKFDASLQSVVDFYRDSAAAVMRLQPEEEVSGAVWNLEGEEAAAQVFAGGFKARSKPAAPAVTTETKPLEKAK